MASLQLHVIGTAIFNALAALASAGELDRFSQHTSILRTEAERFRLWAHSLGLHQQGHSSLDYRVRDAAVIKEGLLEVLSDLKDHLEELVAIASGNRLPFTEESVVEMQDDDVESPGSESMPMSESSSESENSFSEVDFRLHSLTDRIDALFTLAVKLKNPKNRPQRTLDQLFKNIPDEQRIGYIQDREAAETMVISYMHRQQLLQSLSEDNLALLGDSKAKRDDVLAHYTQNAQQLIHRIGRSNVRRKQQFTYWKMHAEKIIRPPAKANQLKTGDKLGTAAPSEVARVALSSATSATKYVDSLQKETDDTSMVSYNSRISTAITPQGEKLEWPAPPTVSVVQSYFTCPYCYMICPAKYLSPESWSKHVSYDLQPYQCTYETCTDEKRIYSEREEWIEHEAQHEMVWHCRNHSVSKEFRPEAAYMQHLKAEHSDSQPELLSERHLADAVARSESPRRDCPLCPTLFSDALELQGHLIYHLERFALATLPFLGDDEGVSNMSDNTSQSNQAQNLGRQNSIERDFGQEDTCSWADDGADDDTAMDDSIDKAGSSVLESYIQENVSQQQDIDFQTWISLIEPQNSAITAAGTTIVIAGGGGFAGFLARELSEQYTILVLSRQMHPEFEAEYGCRVVVVDYHDSHSLEFCLHGVELVISTISGAEQLNLIDAARRARVRCFVPSEFEGSLGHRPSPNDDPLDNGSSTALSQLRHWVSSKHYAMKYTVFSCGVFYERFAPGGLKAYNMGSTCRLPDQGDYMIDVGLGTAELPDTNAQGRSIRITMTSAFDVARFVAAAIELGIDNWPVEFKMRGAQYTPQEIMQLCSEVRQIEFDVINRPYSEIIAWLDYFSQNNEEEKWFSTQHLLQTANGRYTFGEANLNDLVDIQPMGFRQWLYNTWGPVG